MKLTLKVEENVHAILTVPDNTRLPEKIIYDIPCLDCAKMHAAEFVQAGIHDDGPIFKLVGVHQ